MAGGFARHAAILLAVGLLLPTFRAIDVETEIGADGPKVCIWSDNVLPKNVAVMCTHRGKRYISGQFNRFLDVPAKSFVVLNGNNTEVMQTPRLGAISKLEMVNRNQNGNYLSAVSVMVCDDARGAS